MCDFFVTIQSQADLQKNADYVYINEQFFL